MFAIIGLLMVVVACVMVKGFDSWVREKQYRKATVNVLMIGGLLLIVTGLIQEFIK